MTKKETDHEGDKDKVETRFSQQLDAKLTRKLKAQRNPSPGVWFGLGMMGLIGWSVVLPTLAGTALGLWLDEHYPRKQSWTLMLLIAGLVIGCFNAWTWIAKEDKAMHAEPKDQDD